MDGFSDCDESLPPCDELPGSPRTEETGAEGFGRLYAHFLVRHSTVYDYRRPVRFGEHRLMFRPRDSFDQRLLGHALMIEPEPKEIRCIHDVFGNCVAVIDFAGSAKRLHFETSIQLDHTPQHAPDFRIDVAALSYPFSYDPDEALDLSQTIERHHPDQDDEIGRWARQFLSAAGRCETGRLLMTLCYAIHESFVYSRRTEPGTQSSLVTLHLRRGTCRDFALFMMEAVRSLGFAARFVTGYVYVPTRDSADVRGGGSTHA